MPDVTPTTPDLGYAVTLPPQAAIAYLQAKGYAIGFSWQDVWQEAHARAFTAAGVMKVDVLADLKNGLVKALESGGTRQDFIKQVTPLLQAKGWWGRDAQIDPTTGEMLGKGLTPRRLATIFDTNMQSAYMAGRYNALMANVGDRPYWMYVAIMDRRTRPAHAAMNGRTFRYDDPIWNSIYPPNGFRCFPAATRVRADASIGLKTWYAGEMVELATRLGKTLTLTANHPVLTRRGWLPACALQEGDQVLSDAGIVDSRMVGIVDHEQTPTRAEDLFEALSPQGFRIVPMAADDFHGDAFLRKPEIHIAGADRVLMDEIEIKAEQLIGELLEANPGLIALDEVVRVRQFDWAGHVFDFQTATGLMLAEGIVVHNCRCSVRALDGEDLKSRQIDLSSSTGKLSEIEIATSRNPDAPTATVTRFEYAPGKYFHPDAGWSYNPGKAQYQPDLDKYPAAVVRQYVQGALTGPDFALWYGRLEKQVRAGLAEGKGLDDLRGQLAVGQRYPVAVLGAAERTLLGAKSQIVWLSDDTLIKQLVRRDATEMGLQDYWRVAPTIADAQLVIRDGDNSLVFLRRDGRLYHAVVKATRSGQALFLTSFRLSSEQAARQAMKRGQVVRNELGI